MIDDGLKDKVIKMVVLVPGHGWESEGDSRFHSLRDAWFGLGAC